MPEDRGPILLVDGDEVALAYYRTVLEHHDMRNLLDCPDSRRVLPLVAEKGASLPGRREAGSGAGEQG